MTGLGEDLFFCMFGLGEFAPIVSRLIFVVPNVQHRSCHKKEELYMETAVFILLSK